MPSRFPFDVDEAPYDHLRARAAEFLGTKLPPTRRRWAGVYSQVTTADLYHRSQVADAVVLVTGPGGRGMTCSPAIAEETFHRGGTVTGPITVACLDMAGTTVADEGSVMAAFTAAMERFDLRPGAPGYERGERARARDDGPVQDRGLPAQSSAMRPTPRRPTARSS